MTCNNKNGMCDEERCYCQEAPDADHKTIMEEFGEIEEMAKDLAVEAGIVYPSSVFENIAEEDLEAEDVKNDE